MKTVDLERFGMTMAMLCEAFRRPYSEPLVEAYWGALEEFDIDDVTAAMSRAVGECDRMPPPVELRRMLGVLPPDARAMRCWTAVMGAITSIGAYGSVAFDDPPTNAAIRMLGGWVTLCGMDDQQLAYAWHRFKEAYRSCLTAPPDADMIRALPGTHELENRHNGQTDWVKLPTLIKTGVGSTTPQRALPHAAQQGGLTHG